MKNGFSCLVSILFAALCVLSTHNAAADDSYKIGGLFPLSGAGASLGEGNRVGAEIAAERINAAGGINGKKLELLIEDSQSEPSAGLTAFQKLTDSEGVKLVLTTLTSIAMPIRPLAERKQVLVLVESSHPKLTEGFRFTMRNFFPVDTAGDLIEKFAAERSYTDVAIVHAEEEWGEAARRDFESRSAAGKFKLVAAESFPKSAIDFRTQILRLKTAKPQLIFMIGIGPAVAVFYRQAKELDLDVPVIGFFTCGQKNVFEPAKAYVEGHYSIEPVLDKENKELSYLTAEVAKRVPGQRVDQSMLTAFDGVNVLAESMRTSGADAATVRQYLLKKQKFAGATGTIEFTPGGDSRRPTEIQHIRGGVCAPMGAD